MILSVIHSSGPLRCGEKEVKQLIEHFDIVYAWWMRKPKHKDTADD